MLEQLKELVDVETLVTHAVQYAPRAVVGLLILVAFWVLFRVSRLAIRAAFHRGGLHEKLIELLVDRVYRYAVLLVGLIMAADQFGINVGAALAGMGIAGIAVGFAAQDSVANVISGFMIFWDKPFVVGDWVTTAGEYGKVSNITLRTTRIRTPRNTYIVIPNKRIIDEVLENFSKHGNLRLDLPIGIAYKENIPAARDVLLKAVRDCDAPVLDDPAPDVVVLECGDSSVNLNVRVWIESADDKQKTRFTVMEACKLALDDAGIQIPFPHLQLFVDDVQDRVWEGARSLRAG